MSELITIDTEARHLWYAAQIDTEAFLAATLGDPLDLPEAIASRWLREAHDDTVAHLRHLTGADYTEVAFENVYNCENDFSEVFQFGVWMPGSMAGAEWCYQDEFIYITVEVHQGGDVRGNYGAGRLYRPDTALAENGFLDWTLGWGITDRHGEVRERMTERASPGYASSPTCELEDMLRSDAVRWRPDRNGFLALDTDGCPVLLYPECFVG